MLSPLVIGIAAFIGVTTLVGGIAMLVLDRPSAKIEDRLQLLTGAGSTGTKDLFKQASVLSEPLDDKPGFLETLANRFGDVGLLFEQADVQLNLPRMAIICAVLAAFGIAGGLVLGLHVALLPVVAGFLALIPVVWLLWRRRRRLRAFGVQLPEALDMLGRALRSGQSLSSGMNMVSAEIGAPLGKEFGRVFEEQNLGVSIEDSLKSLADRVPNLDLKFFATAVILQRQTGGDLAEILDKISHLIRERFEIWGQIQSLTGEGRLSGVVLLALPVLIFVVMYRLNHDYVMVLFTDPMGKKLLVGAVILQILGALVIRKIVDIKV
jgi:tight adherence protein B